MLRHSLLFVAAVIFVTACSPPESPETVSKPQEESVDPTPKSASSIPEKPFKSILDYGLFEDTEKQIPAEGVLAYFPINENFSDYATVRRFIKLPEGTQMAYRETKPFAFPVDTVIAQSFSFQKDRRDPSLGEDLIETRILIRRDWDGWEAVPYVWNEDKTDARRSVAGAIKEVAWIHDDGSDRELKYLVPNSNQCVRCHENNEGYIVQIGTTARNLNNSISCDENTTNQLVNWRDQHVLTGLPESLEDIPRLAQWNDPASGTAQSRARAFLDSNCSFCHNPNGHGSTSGLDLRFNQDDPIKYGVYKPPVAAGRGSDGLKYSIHPGSPAESFLIQRLTSTDPAIMMPPVGRRTTSDEAVKVIREWIAEMSFSVQEAGRLIVEQKENFENYMEEGSFSPDEE